MELARARATHAGALFQRAAELFIQRAHGHSQFFQQRPRHPFPLREQRQQKMLVRNLLVRHLRGEVLRTLQRLLHFLRKTVGSHRLPFLLG